MPLAQRFAVATRRAGNVIAKGWTGEALPRVGLNIPLNFWQVPVWRGGSGSNAAVEACVSAISQAVAMLPAYHWHDNDDGGRSRVTTSAASRVMHKPNSYQTRADFILNLLRCELFTGAAHAVARRNNRAEITDLHLLPQGSANHIVDREEGAIFYAIGYQSHLGRDFSQTRLVPARDVLHLRLHTPRDPLQGETPLAAAALAVDIGNSIARHESAFFSNMARPSGVIETDMQLTRDQTNELRARWLENSQGENSGGTPILSWGLKWKPLTITSVDAQIIDAYKLSKIDIASVYRVPPILIGVESAATYNNTEQLMRNWHATGLGFIIEHLELALAALFNLPQNEYIEFDVDYLLRSDFRERMEGLAKAVLGGVYSPNEARAKEGLPSKQHGDEPRLQAQQVPLSAYFDAPKTVVTPSAPSAPTTPGQAANDEGEPPDEDDDEQEPPRSARPASKAFSTEEWRMKTLAAIPQ